MEQRRISSASSNPCSPSELIQEVRGVSGCEDQVLKAAELVAYQEGAIVSRTLIDKPTGTITLFAFDQGEGLSEHTAPFDALAYILDGEAEVTISGRACRLKAGEMIIMPANEPHSLRAITGFKMLLVMIKA